MSNVDAEVCVRMYELGQVRCEGLTCKMTGSLTVSAVSGDGLFDFANARMVGSADSTLNGPYAE